MTKESKSKSANRFAFIGNSRQILVKSPIINQQCCITKRRREFFFCYDLGGVDVSFYSM